MLGLEHTASLLCSFVEPYRGMDKYERRPQERREIKGNVITNLREIAKVEEESSKTKKKIQDVLQCLQDVTFDNYLPEGDDDAYKRARATFHIWKKKLKRLKQQGKKYEKNEATLEEVKDAAQTLYDRIRDYYNAIADTEWAAYVQKHNRLADFTAAAVRAAYASGTPIGVENPADRGDDDSPAFWPEFADHGSIWLYRPLRDALEAAGAELVTFAQCHESLGGAAHKWTSIASTGQLAARLAPLRRCLCAHGREPHGEVLSGYAADGVGRAARAALYPAGFAARLAEAAVEAARASSEALDGVNGQVLLLRVAEFLHSSSPQG